MIFLYIFLLDLKVWIDNDDLVKDDQLTEIYHRLQNIEKGQRFETKENNWTKSLWKCKPKENGNGRHGLSGNGED